MGRQRVYSTPCRRWDSTRLPGYRRNTSTGTVSAVGMRKFRILSREQTGPKASARILNELRQTNYATPNPLIRNTDSSLFQFARFVFYNIPCKNFSKRCFRTGNKICRNSKNSFFSSHLCKKITFA